jgi:hypothetical protein
MESKEERLARFVEAIKWAQVPENRETLPDDLKAFLDIIEERMAELKPVSGIGYNATKMTVNLPEIREVTLTSSPLPYNIRR